MFQGTNRFMYSRGVDRIQFSVKLAIPALYFIDEKQLKFARTDFAFDVY